MISLGTNSKDNHRMDKWGDSIKQVFTHLIISIFFLIAVTLGGCEDGVEEAGRIIKEKNTYEDKSDIAKNRYDRKNGSSLAKDHDMWQFNIRSTEFSIPKKYAKEREKAHNGAREGAAIWALLPNFEGYNEAVNQHAFKESYNKERRIQITLINQSGRMKVPKIVTDQSDKNGYTVLGGRHRGGKYDEMRYGLEYYRTDFEVFRSVYLYRNNGVPEILLRCDEDQQSRYPSCYGSWAYNDEVAVNFNFSSEYLPQWQDIMVNIKKLLDGELNCCTDKSNLSAKGIDKGDYHHE